MHEETEYPVVHPKWREWVRWYLWGSAVAAILISVGLFAHQLYFWLSWRREFGEPLIDLDGIRNFWPIFMIVIVGASTSLRTAVRYRKLTALVSEHDGAVCPRCVQPMQVVDSEQGGDEVVRCERCTSTSSRHELRTYWGGFPGPSWRSRRQWLTQQQARWRAEELVLQVKRWLIRNPRRSSVASMLHVTAMFSLFVLFMVSIGSGFHLAPVYLFFAAAPVVLIVAMFIVLGLAIEPFEQDTLLCRVCRYEKHGSEYASPRCPECGSPWDAIGGVLYIGHRFNQKALYAAVPLGILGFVITMSSMFLPQRLATSDTLINIIAAGSGDFLEWDELRNRELSEEQAERLMEIVLEQRDAGHRLEGSANLWLSQQIVGIDDELLVRILDGMLVMTLDGPDTLSVGEPIELALVVDRRSIAAPGPVMAYFGGFFVDDDPEPISRSENPVNISRFGRSHSTDRWAAYRTDPYEPTISLTGDKAGEIVVTARVWVTAVPRGVRRSDLIEWNEDGSPTLPDGVLWMKEIHLEHRVRITP